MSIADKITRLQNARNAISQAITAKGGTVGSGDGFEDFASDIGSIVIPSIQSLRTETLSENGRHTIPPTTGYDAMRTVEVTVNVPQPSIYPGTVNKSTITSNGTYTISSPSGYDAMSSVKVPVNVPQPSVYVGTVTAAPITANGTYTIPPPDGYDAMEKAEVTVDLTIPKVHSGFAYPTITSRTLAVTIPPPTGYDAMKSISITVDVPGPSGNLNITDTQSHNVSDYATAKVVDSDLVAGNIKSGVNILGVLGTFSGPITGTFTLSADVDTDTVVEIVNASTIGFTPNIFILARDTASTTRYHIQATSYITFGGSSHYRSTVYRSSSSNSTSSNANGWTTSTSGHLYYSSSVVHVKCSSTYIMGAGTYTWYAIQ